METIRSPGKMITHPSEEAETDSTASSLCHMKMTFLSFEANSVVWTNHPKGGPGHFPPLFSNSGHCWSYQQRLELSPCLVCCHLWLLPVSHKTQTFCHPTQRHVAQAPDVQHPGKEHLQGAPASVPVGFFQKQKQQ